VSGATPAAAPSAGNEEVVASLLARAEQMPSDPMEQMRELSRAREAKAPGAASSTGSAQSTASDSVAGWWQRQRDDD